MVARSRLRFFRLCLPSAGTTMPCSLGVNPLLTITALAERALLHMGADLGFECTDR